jgi:hypothetical protein
VELKPAEQVALACLLRSGSASEATLRAVIEEHSRVLAPELADVVSALVDQGLAGVRIEPDLDGSTRTLVTTAKAERLKGRIPEDPQTVTEFWI